MQIIVNCVVLLRGKLVMLQKPRRGWWVAPGGKVEPTELWPDAAAREMSEEAGLTVGGLELRGVYRHRIEETRADASSDGEEVSYKERLIAQFSASEVEGELLSYCKEGKLDLIGLDEWEQIPMDEGDRMMIRHSLQTMETGDKRVNFGIFTYTSEHKLVNWSMSLSSPLDQTTTGETVI